MAQAEPGRNQAEEQEADRAGYAFGGSGMLDEEGAEGRVHEAVGDAEEPDDEAGHGACGEALQDELDEAGPLELVHLVERRRYELAESFRHGAGFQ